MNNEAIILELKEKLEAAEKERNMRRDRRKNDSKAIKELDRKIAAYKNEIKLRGDADIGEYLRENGILFDNVREAVQNGVLKKSEPKADGELTKQNNVENVSPVTREGEEAEGGLDE